MQARESGSPLLPKPVEQFRDYEHAAPRVEQFYALNHTHQTVDFVRGKKREYLGLDRKEMTRFFDAGFGGDPTPSSTIAIRTSTSRRSSMRCRLRRRSAPPISRGGSS